MAKGTDTRLHTPTTRVRLSARARIFFSCFFFAFFCFSLFVCKKKIIFYFCVLVYINPILPGGGGGGHVVPTLTLTNYNF